MHTVHTHCRTTGFHVDVDGDVISLVAARANAIEPALDVLKPARILIHDMDSEH